jgi:hypothetical protein
MGLSMGRRWFSWAVAGAVVAWSVVQTVAFTSGRCCHGSRADVKVPTLVGWEVDHARRLADSFGLSTRLVYRSGPFLRRRDTVLDQRPLRGEVTPGSALTLVVTGDAAAPLPPKRRSIVARVSVSSRSGALRALGQLGFIEAAVLSIGTPTEIKVYRVGHLHTKTRYSIPCGQDVTLTQSNGYSRVYGHPIRVRRSHNGVLQSDTLSWVERGYALSLSPPRREYAAALSWQPGDDPPKAMDAGPSATGCRPPSAS